MTVYCIKKMDCNCFMDNCAYKIPASAIVSGVDTDDLILRVKNVITGELRLISFNTWSKWCDNLCCDPIDGKRYELYTDNCAK